MNRLICLGDSITDCGRLFEHSPLGYGYVCLLEENLNLGQKLWSVENRGVDGFTAGMLLRQVRSRRLLGEEETLGQKDRLVILNQIGINDIALMMNTSRTKEQIRQMMNAFVLSLDELVCTLFEQAAPRRPLIAFIEPFVFSRPAYLRNWAEPAREMSKALNALCAHHGLTFIPCQEILNQAAEDLSFYQLTVDGIHLTTHGHAILANAILNGPAAHFWNRSQIPGSKKE